VTLVAGAGGREAARILFVAQLVFWFLLRSLRSDLRMHAHDMNVMTADAHDMNMR
jgi:hypothetical protein